MILKIALLIFASINSFNLSSWYQGYNDKYFQGELPVNTVVSFDLRDDRFMALTEHSGSYFRIDFNPKYNNSPKVARMTLLHEMCHIRQFVESEREFDDHGIKWQTCMMNLAKQGAMSDLW